jgi:hypothetical protein
LLAEATCRERKNRLPLRLEIILGILQSNLGAIARGSTSEFMTRASCPASFPMQISSLYVFSVLFLPGFAVAGLVLSRRGKARLSG